MLWALFVNILAMEAQVMFYWTPKVELHRLFRAHKNGIAKNNEEEMLAGKGIWSKQYVRRREENLC